MNLCITAEGENLDSPVDGRFGRCQFFIFVDQDSMSFEAVKNTALSSTGGAGIQAAQLVVMKGAGSVLTGNVGPMRSIHCRQERSKLLRG